MHDSTNSSLRKVTATVAYGTEQLHNIFFQENPNHDDIAHYWSLQLFLRKNEQYRSEVHQIRFSTIRHLLNECDRLKAKKQILVIA